MSETTELVPVSPEGVGKPKRKAPKTAFKKGMGKIPGSGKPKGFKSERVLKREQETALANARIEAETPIEFFAAVLKDKNMPHKERKEAAKELLPYMHPKLTSIEARGGGMGHEERLAMLMEMLEDAKNG